MSLKTDVAAGTSRWTDALLDAKRERGDPLADEVIASLEANGEIGAVDRMMLTLVRNDGIPSAELPPIVADYLARTSAMPIVDPEKIRRGERLFGLYGPEMLMALGFYSLPASYAARKGVQVLYRSAYLLKRPMRRVFETTQLVVDVMASGGLEPNGDGVRSAQKVRLMHAAIRYLETHDAKRPWDPELGVPINQEDLAGTLMTFAYVVLEGLDRMGIRVSDEDQEAYLHAWTVVGTILGIDADLLPATIAEARELTYTIRRRQIAASPEGRAMTAALIQGYEGLMPDLFHGFAPSMVRYFLDADVFEGIDVAEMLGVPPADWTAIFVRAVADLGDLVHWFGSESNEVAKLLRFMSRKFVGAMLLVERGGNRTPFAIPDSLQALWGTGGAA